MRLALVAGLAVAGLLGSAPQVASAYTTSGFVWRVVPVNYALDANSVGTAQGGPGLATAEATLTEALSAWNGTGSEWQGVAAPNLTSHAASNRINEIFWVRNWDPAMGDANQVLAVASTTYTTLETGLESDIIFNGDTLDWATGIAVRRSDGAVSRTTVLDVMLHEMGHSLGLGHSESSGTIMYFQAGDPIGALTNDDIAGILALYPPGAPLCTSSAQCPLVPGSIIECSGAGRCELVIPGEFGASCETTPCNRDAGLSCYNFPTGMTCSKPCINQDSCGDALFCIRQDTGSYCMPPGPTATGDVCTLRSDCQSGTCIELSCRSNCSNDCECPTGNFCETTTANNVTLSYCASGASTCVRCGDGEIGGDEECDDGDANSDFQPDACRTGCLAARCGDGTEDSDEQCDDGNAIDGDGCSAVCTLGDEPGPIRLGGDGGPGETPNVTGGCQTGGGTSNGWAVLALALLAAVLRRHK